MSDFDPEFDKLSDLPSMQVESDLMVLARRLTEAKAERDALAHVIERGRALRMESGEHLSPWAKDALDKLLAESDSAKAMALHDAEVKAQAILDFAASYDDEWIGGGAVSDYAAGRAAAIRATAK